MSSSPTTSSSDILLGLAAAAAVGVTAYALFTSLSANKQESTTPNPVHPYPSGMSFTRAPTTQKFGFHVNLQSDRGPSVIELLNKAECRTDSDTRITLDGSHIRIEQFDNGMWMLNGATNAFTGANRIHINYNYGYAVVHDESGQQVIVEAQASVFRSTRSAGPVNWIALTNATYDK